MFSERMNDWMDEGVLSPRAPESSRTKVPALWGERRGPSSWAWQARRTGYMFGCLCAFRRAPRPACQAAHGSSTLCQLWGGTRPGRAGRRRGLQMASHLAAQEAVWAGPPAPPPHAVFPFPLCSAGPVGAPGWSEGAACPRPDSWVSSGHPGVCWVCIWPQGPA